MAAADHIVLFVGPAVTPPPLKGGGGVRGGTETKPGVAVVVLYEEVRDRFIVFGPGDVDQARNRIHMADFVSGYNILRGGLPLLWGQSWHEFRVGGYFRQVFPRANDLIQRITLAQGMHPDSVSDMHVQFPLDALGRGTVGKGRVGDDNSIPEYHAAGNWPAVTSFALDDCGLVKDLVYFAARYGYLVHGPSNFRIDLRHAAARNQPENLIRTPDEQPLPQEST